MISKIYWILNLTRLTSEFNSMNQIKYQICTKTVMDTTDKEIKFDSNGVSNHYYVAVQHLDMLPKVSANDFSILQKKFDSIKASGKGQEYDCIMGLSGGVDSSYVAYLAAKFNLRPLVVHLDNGWNSELAVKNIEQIVAKLKLDLHTHVIDWDEFRDLQRAFIKANVVDIELLTDHAITAVIHKLAAKYNIKYILSGSNYSTESIMPTSWCHRKSDQANLLNIHKQFGTHKLKTYPTASTLKLLTLKYFRKFETVNVLNLIQYDKNNAMKLLQNELSWKYYGGKHYESVFTKFYQAYILPKKFNIDKRRAHLSALICSNQITRELALEELNKPLYNEKELEQDLSYVSKKLGISSTEWNEYFSSPEIPHSAYGSDQWIFDLLWGAREFVRKFSITNNRPLKV
jgi:N-acetyl sugar amidotransferase